MYYFSVRVQYEPGAVQVRRVLDPRVHQRLDVPANLHPGRRCTQQQGLRRWTGTIDGCTTGTIDGCLKPFFSSNKFFELLNLYRESRPLRGGRA